VLLGCTGLVAQIRGQEIREGCWRGNSLCAVLCCSVLSFVGRGHPMDFLKCDFCS
jgi:hypothetical protein